MQNHRGARVIESAPEAYQPASEVIAVRAPAQQVEPPKRPNDAKADDDDLYDNIACTD
jgi:hypothetical protein